MANELTCTVEDLANAPLDVLVVGSGPAAVAVAEHLYDDAPDARIGLIERGGILATTHINNVLGEAPGGRVDSPTNLRAAFISDHERFLWKGAFAPFGMMILALGGRGLVAGAQLRRFYRDDFDLWKNGVWLVQSEQLSDYYTEAEVRRHVRSGDCDGAAQHWVRGALFDFGAAAPPWGVDSPTLKNFETGLGYDSAVARLWRLLLLDHQRSKTGAGRRLYVALDTYGTRLVVEGTHVRAVRCVDVRQSASKEPRSVDVPARLIVLAASPVESARLMLNSKLGSPATGRFLAEHNYYRRSILVKPPAVVGDIRRLAVRLVIPPRNRELLERFQIEVLGEEDPATGYLRLRFTGEVAMDPQADNRVTLSESTDEFGVPQAMVTISLSDDDRLRQGVMQARIVELAMALGISREQFEANASNEIVEYQPGRSHHEAGTLRMGAIDDREELRVTDRLGRVIGIDNLYVGDASVFPCVGVANPMLTVTALGYRLAVHLARVLKAI